MDLQSAIKQLTENTDWQKDQLSFFEECVASKHHIPAKTLIILQSECGSIESDRFECIGSPFATTCNIVFFINKQCTKAACAHFDEAVDTNQLDEVLNLFKKHELENEGIDLYLIGGYLDEKSTSIKVWRSCSIYVSIFPMKCVEC